MELRSRHPHSSVYWSLASNVAQLSGCMIWYGPLPILDSYTPRTAAIQSYYSGAEHTTKCSMEALWSKYISSCQHFTCHAEKTRRHKMPWFKYL